MKIYLDIDGVLLTKTGEPATGLLDFLKRVTEHDCYWLTTHCKDDSLDHVKMHLKPKVSNEEWLYIEKIKANGWDYLKTEGIDFSSDFLWFDDNLLHAERQVLKENDTLNNFRLVELKKYPDQLLQELI
jgi:hypothetical protein